MATEIRLPQWGMGMQEGTVARWLKKVGERVEVGDELVEIEAAKVTQAITSTVTGVLLRILVEEGQTIPVRTAVALVGTPEEARATAPVRPAETPAAAVAQRDTAAPQGGGYVQITPVARRAAKELGIDLSLVHGTGPGGRIDEADVRAYAEAQRPPTQAAAANVAASAAGGRVQITPLARRVAKDLGIDLGLVRGTGPGGRIDEADVRAYAKAQPPTQAPSTGVGEQEELGGGRADEAAPLDAEVMTGMRRTIARRMLDSLHTTAQLTLFTEVDVTEFVSLRERLKRDFDVTYTDLIVQATAKALEQHPLLNASLDGERIQRHSDIHIGIAVALPEGLIVPVIHNANRKSLREIASEAKRLAEHARAGQLTVGEATGSTFSITNLGAYGIDGFTPIINVPEAAILGVGRIVEKPAAYRGVVALRHMLTLSLTHDHRLVDGAPAAAFLHTIAEMLAMPYLMTTGEEPRSP